MGPRGETGASGFSEREFYLREFRGRTLAIAVPEAELRQADALSDTLDELTCGGSRVVVLSPDRERLEKLLDGRWLSASKMALEAEVWRALREVPRLGLVVDADRPLLESTRELVVRLGLFKLVLIDPAGGLVRGDGERCSFLHVDELRAILAGGERGLQDAGRGPLLEAVERMLAQGIPAVNVCSLAGLAGELFTYAGSGTLFTRERYVTVRRLGIDDFDAAADLMARGVLDGFLVPRPAAEVDRVLASGFGAFVEGRYLAGIGALLRHPDADSGEIASLYAVTRFLGEGIGPHLVAFALEHARVLGLSVVFACTASPRAGAFFERQGFQRVSHDELPASKWRDYDPERRGRLFCFRRDV
jgi:amino-acid N-acetyltransferase